MLSQPTASRSALARERVREASAALGACVLCAHRCGVNRLTHEQGLCHAGPSPRWFAAQTESGEEAELCPSFTVSLSGCDLRCDFCVTGRESWNPRAGKPFVLGPLAEKARQALIAGARTIQILGGEPTIHLPAVIELVSLLPDDAHLVWKTNGHGSAEARRLLDGLFDTWLVDFKFGNDACGERLARVSQYLAAVRANLAWARPRTNLIVRHLLMPGHLRCCWEPVAAWIARELPRVKVSLRTGFWPAWHSSRHPELTVGASREDTALAWRIAAEYGLNLVPSGIDMASASTRGRGILSASAARKRTGCARRREVSTPAEGEILILPDGRVLSHNTTTALAGLMQSLSRAGKESHEFSG